MRFEGDQSVGAWRNVQLVLAALLHLAKLPDVFALARACVLP